MIADYGTSNNTGNAYIHPRFPLSDDPSSDEPGFQAGVDTDQDGGVVAYTTPTEFKVAVKRMYFKHSDGTKVELIQDAGKLSDSTVIDLKTPQSLDAATIKSGTYTRFYAEFYYLDLKMELNAPGNQEMIRLYLSDDDFDGEGNLGHHQGDIQLKDNNGEFKFVLPGYSWADPYLVPARSGDIDQDGTTDHIRGATDPDPETGHHRGLFGNNGLWNATAFQQGANQDIFIIDEPVNISIQESGGTVSITFDLKNTWYFEDFDSNGVFNPCVDKGNRGENAIKDGCDEKATWAPILPNIVPSYSK